MTRTDRCATLARHLFTCSRAHLSRSPLLLQRACLGVPRSQARARWQTALAADSVRALPKHPLPEWCARVVFGVRQVRSAHRADTLSILLDALDHGAVARLAEEPFAVWELEETPNPALRTPIYNLEGPASSTPLGEIYPFRSLRLDPRFVSALSAALRVAGLEKGVLEVLRARASVIVSLPSGRSRRFPR